jgi:hypothetical protein
VEVVVENHRAMASIGGSNFQKVAPNLRCVKCSGDEKLPSAISTRLLSRRMISDLTIHANDEALREFLDHVKRASQVIRWLFPYELEHNWHLSPATRLEFLKLGGR